MKTHELKTWTEPFAHVVAGYKTHEARKNDREFKVGDRLLLREWIPDAPEACDYQASGGVLTGTYTSRTCLVRVMYITPGGAYGLPADLCVMSIEFIAKEP